jgi:hypothetical protein
MKRRKDQVFLCFSPVEAALDDLLLTAFSRWRVERSFQDTKRNLRFSKYEGRSHYGLLRHLLLCAVTYYFVQWHEHSKKRRFDILSGCPCDGGGMDAVYNSVTHYKDQRILPTAQRLGNVLPPTNKTETNRSPEHQFTQNPSM